MMDVITNPFCLIKLVGATDVFDVSCTSYVDVFRILLMTFDRARIACRLFLCIYKLHGKPSSPRGTTQALASCSACHPIRLTEGSWERLATLALAVLPAAHPARRPCRVPWSTAPWCGACRSCRWTARCLRVEALGRPGCVESRTAEEEAAAIAAAGWERDAPGVEAEGGSTGTRLLIKLRANRSGSLVGWVAD
jgi:hypothetical protein